MYICFNILCFCAQPLFPCERGMHKLHRRRRRRTLVMRVFWSSAAAAPVRPRPANWYSYFISTISLVLDEWWVFYLNIQLQLKRHKLSALGELFEDEDRARQKAWWAAAQVPSPTVKKMDLYKSLPAVLSFDSWPNDMVVGKEGPNASACKHCP